MTGNNIKGSKAPMESMSHTGEYKNDATLKRRIVRFHCICFNLLDYGIIYHPSISNEISSIVNTFSKYR